MIRWCLMNMSIYLYISMIIHASLFIHMFNHFCILICIYILYMYHLCMIYPGVIQLDFVENPPVLWGRSWARCRWHWRTWTATSPKCYLRHGEIRHGSGEIIPFRVEKKEVLTVLKEFDGVSRIKLFWKLIGFKWSFGVLFGSVFLDSQVAHPNIFFWKLGSTQKSRSPMLHHNSSHEKCSLWGLPRLKQSQVSFCWLHIILLYIHIISHLYPKKTIKQSWLHILYLLVTCSFFITYMSLIHDRNPILHELEKTVK